MKAIRRIYIYLVAYVSLEVVVWSAIGLARSAFNRGGIGDGLDQLASALAFILVGLPVFFIHWRLAQRDAEKDPEERFSGMRAIFLYGTLLSLLVPVVQNLLVIVGRVVAVLLDLDPSRHLAIGHAQTWSDNLTAMAVNGILAIYFYTVIQANWKDTPVGNWFPLIRRIARYLVMLYGFVMLFAGVEQLVSFLFDLAGTVGGGYTTRLPNALSFTLVGAPLWVVAWRLIQKSLDDTAERESQLRLGILYGLTFLAVVVTLISSGGVINEVLLAVFGAEAFDVSLVSGLGDYLSVMIPALVSWMFYNRALKQSIEAASDVQHQAGMRRLYAYVLALLGLGAAFIGTFMLVDFLIDLVVFPVVGWGSGLERNLADALTTLLVGLPIWLWAWRQMLAETSQEGEAGDHARRSVIRKGYLYFILFVGVMGVMGSTGTLLYHFIRLILGDDIPDFFRLILDNVVILILFVVLSIYHWRSVHKDNQLAAKALSALHAEFAVCVFDYGEGGFAENVISALEVVCPDVPVAVHPVGETFDETLRNAKAAILPAALATDPPETVRLWLGEFPGVRLFVPTKAEGWRWVGFSDQSMEVLAKEAAKAVCRLAEGQEAVRSRSLSGWTVFGYVIGALVGLWAICGLVSLLMETFY
jgi:hypothetical protein